jgi:N-acetylglucosaminyldiphosphoundecaprenol N-acetyl-beta-D-mannosaminyltransferase
MTRRFLVVQMADLGDLILSMPALDALRVAHPDAHITLLTTPHAAPLAAGLDCVNEILTAPRLTRWRAVLALLGLIARVRRGRFDTVILLHHLTTWGGTLKYAALLLGSGAGERLGLDNGRGWFLTGRVPDGGFGALHQTEYWLRVVTLADADATPRRARMSITEADRTWAAAKLPKTTRPRVVVHAGGGGDSLARRWEPAKFAAAADALTERRDAEIVLVGGPADDSAAVRAAMTHTPADLTGRTTLGQLGAVLETADIFIGAESGVMHMAAAAGAPLVAVFGPGNPDAWAPWTPESPALIVRSAPECSPCSYVGHGTGLRAGCAARTCIAMVTPEMVVAAAERMLDGQVPRGQAVIPRRASSQVRHPRRIDILGIPVSIITYAEWLSLIGTWLAEERGTPHHVCTVNPEFLMIARSDSNFANILRRADLTVPDGVGLLWASRRLGQPLPERVTGSDGVPLIAERAAREGWSLFLLGAGQGVAQRAADELVRRYPGLKIAGVYSGSPAGNEEAGIVARVNASGADILFVAYGAPEQDKWIARNLPRLHVTMAMGVGGAFDFIAGVVPRAPETMRRLGLEWLYRLYLQPWRFRRMLRLPRFVLAVLFQPKKRASS